MYENRTEKKRGKNFWASGVHRKLSVITVLLLLLSVMPAVVSNNGTESISTMTKNIVFSVPEIRDDGEYVTIDVEGATNVLKAGKPILPVKKVIFEFPMGTTISDVTCNHPSPQTMTLSKQVEPGPKPLPLVYSGSYPIAERLMKFFGKIFSRFPSRFQNPMDDNTFVMDKNIYGSKNYWPDNWFTYRTMVGLNKAGESTTFVVVDVNMMRYSPGTSTIQYIADVTVDVSHKEPSYPSAPFTGNYDLLILAPSDYIRDLDPLVDHKEDVGISTKLVCLDDVYDDEATEVGRDDAEKVKLYIEKAKRESNIKYVLLVGGYRTFLGFNKPNQQFPLRYCHLDDGAEDGYVSDLYFADIYKYDSSGGYVFDDWDSNGNGIFAEWGWQGKDELDFMPDVYVGRLACRNTKEVQTMVDKIITYETETYGEEWFNKMVVISGDGFQDAPDWKIHWNTNQVPTGEYTIYAQSQLKSNPSVKGPIDVVTVTVDHSTESIITFSEDDHLKIDPLDPDSEGMVYPAHPVAEITVPSEGDILGNTDVSEVPRGAYSGKRWTKIEYNATHGIMKIKGKSYDPRPFPDSDYGSHTNYRVWIENIHGTIVKDFPLAASDMWWEGETETQIAMDYMSNDFEKQVLWTSNGNFTGQGDVIKAMNEGSGFVYFAGHGNPMVWANHYPGIPGGRGHASIYGLKNFGYTRPFFPMDKLRNREKLPVLLVGGCHNSMIDTCLMKLLYDPREVLVTVKHGAFIPECWSWWLARVQKGGAIATIGNTGLGYGYLGKHCIHGLGGWINPEFFRQYASGVDILGETYGQTVASYITTFNPYGDQIHAKTVEEWVFLGDPSLKIGGYGSSAASEAPASSGDVLTIPLSNAKIISNSNDNFLPCGIANEVSGDNYKVTTNPYIDSDVTGLTGFNGNFLVGYSREDDGVKNAGFAVSCGGTVWDEMLWFTPGDASDTSIQHLENKTALVSCMFDDISFGVWTAPDFTKPSTWSRTAWYFPSGTVTKLGKTGLTVTGQRDKFGAIEFGGLWSCDWQGLGDAVMFMFDQDDYVHGIGGVFEHFSGDVDESTGWHYWVCSNPSGGGLMIVGTPPSTYTNTMISGGFAYPDVAADDGYAYIVFGEGATIKVKVSTNNGATWSIYSIASKGEKPEIVINQDGSLDCYYIVDDAIIKSHSDTHGQTWEKVGTVVLEGVDYDSTFDVTTDALVYGADDGDLYVQMYIDTACAIIRDITSPSKGYITANITNSGNTELKDAKWEVKIESANPVGDFFFGGKIPILKGHILLGRIPRSRTVDLAVGESIEVQSKRIFGFGYINVVVTMYNEDDEILGTSFEDGFLLGSRLLLYHPIE